MQIHFSLQYIRVILTLFLMSSRMFSFFTLIILLLIPGESEPKSYFHAHEETHDCRSVCLSVILFNDSLMCMAGMCCSCTVVFQFCRTNTDTLSSVHYAYSDRSNQTLPGNTVQTLEVQFLCSCNVFVIHWDIERMSRINVHLIC